MRAVYLNGKDVNIDADFFEGLGADRDSMTVMVDSPGSIKETYHYEFTIDGNRYRASWLSLSNRLTIKCIDLEFKDREIASNRLYELTKIITPDMLGNFIVRQIIARPEGDMPELVMMFYEE